jgi:uncharacterized protein YndB with AHSA1/START domain
MRGRELAAMWVSRWIPQPPAKVFQAWTTPAVLEQWLISVDGGSAEAVVDLQPSGAFAISAKASPGTVVQHGIYREIWPPHRLVYTWCAPSYFDGEATVTVSTVPVEDETLLTIGVSEPAWSATSAYWQDALGRLRAVMLRPGMTEEISPE